jgi:CheY-like chemotaxis protein
MADKKKVLLVDDDAEILALLRLLLQNAGHEVVVTTHPSMVLRLVHEESPDLIVCDINMDERTGGEVVADLAGDPQGKEIPFLFLSSLVKEEEIDADGRVGGLAMISKSAPREKILERIGSMLSGG